MSWITVSTTVLQHDCAGGEPHEPWPPLESQVLLGGVGLPLHTGGVGATGWQGCDGGVGVHGGGDVQTGGLGGVGGDGGAHGGGDAQTGGLGGVGGDGGVHGGGECGVQGGGDTQIGSQGDDGGVQGAGWQGAGGGDVQTGSHGGGGGTVGGTKIIGVMRSSNDSNRGRKPFTLNMNHLGREGGVEAVAASVDVGKGVRDADGLPNSKSNAGVL